MVILIIFVSIRRNKTKFAKILTKIQRNTNNFIVYAIGFKQRFRDVFKGSYAPMSVLYLDINILYNKYKKT